MNWVAENTVAIIGWIGTIVLFSFLFGRRLSKLEGTDENLTKAVTTLTAGQRDLSDAVQALTAHVNGHSGNTVLSRSIDALTAGLSTLGQRITDTERALALHESRLARLDEMRTFITEQFSSLSANVNEMKMTLMKLEVQSAMREKENGHG